MTDAELINSFKNGNTSSFIGLVKKWEKPIYNFALRNLGSKHSAEDVCQTVFLKAFENLHKLKDPEKFKQWIFTIAANLCRDEFKRRKKFRQKTVSISFNETNMFEEITDTDSELPDDRFNNMILKDILKDALMQIPEQQRTVIIMKQYHNLKFHEIAKITKTSENTVKSRLYYGLKTLRKILENNKINREVLTNGM